MPILVSILRSQALALLALAILVSACPGLAAATGGEGEAAAVQSPDSLVHQVESFIAGEHAGSDVGIRVSPIDPRLRLRRCSEPLQASWSAGSRTIGRVAVSVACPVDAGWQVRLQAEVVVHADAWVLVRSVQRGEQLARSHVRAERVELGGMALTAHAGNPVQQLDTWLGMRFRSAQRQGNVLFDRMLEASDLIQRGDTVQVVSMRAGIAVATDAEALGSGALGERIRLRNRRSGMTFEATVSGRAAARIE